MADIFATIAMTMFLKWSSTGISSYVLLFTCVLLTEVETHHEIYSTEKMLKSLMQFVVQRGFLVTFVQVLLMITFYTLPNNLVW